MGISSDLILRPMIRQWKKNKVFFFPIMVFFFNRSVMGCLVRDTSVGDSFSDVLNEHELLKTCYQF